MSKVHYLKQHHVRSLCGVRAATRAKFTYLATGVTCPMCLIILGDGDSPLRTWHEYVAKSSDPGVTASNLERNIGLDARKLLDGAAALKARAIAHHGEEDHG